jgi:hypothetical protein
MNHCGRIWCEHVRSDSDVVKKKLLILFDHKMASRADSGKHSTDDRDYEIAMESGGLIGTILSKNLSKSEPANKSETEFDLQKLPDPGSRLFDTTLRTHLNG